MVISSSSHINTVMKKMSVALVVFMFMLELLVLCRCEENLEQNFDITWGDGRGRIVNKGQLLMLSLDHFSGSGFQSKKEYLFGKIDMQIKLVPGNSAGTVTAYYLSSKGETHDEIDYEFLGNQTGQPYTVHTNVYTGGKGEREQQFHLWFDPTSDFHTYSILWNLHSILFSIDGIPIRQFKNMEKFGIPYPRKQAMKLYSSIWDADDWATQGGRIKTDWTQAPFSSSYRNFKADACVWIPASRTSSCPPPTYRWLTHNVDGRSHGQLNWVRKNYMIYDYCSDAKRFPQGLPKECHLQYN